MSENVARESSRVGARDERFAAGADRVDRIRGDRFGDGANQLRTSQLTRADSQSARTNHADGRAPTIDPGPSGSADAWRSNSAADAAGLEQLGLCIAGVKQPSARRSETTEAVAKHECAAGSADAPNVAVALVRSATSPRSKQS